MAGKERGKEVREKSREEREEEVKEGGKEGRNVDSHIQPLAKSITLANSPPFSGLVFSVGML